MSMTDDIRTFVQNSTAPLSVNEIALGVGVTNKQASSALSRLVKSGEVNKSENGAFTPGNVAEETAEDLIGEVETPTPAEPSEEPAPTEPEQPVDLKHVEVREFPGNYSIAMIPFTETLAGVFDGISVRSENVKGSLVRKAFISSDRKADLTAFVKVLDAKAAEVFPALKAWQKENIEKRRGLTDMERYLQHRKFITDFAASAASEIAGKKA